MPNGRPSKLTNEAIEKALAYIDGGFVSEGDAIPSAVGLACLLNVSKSTIYKWAEDHPSKFSDILAKCNARQEKVLLTGGLTGELNSNICKLVLGKHGYHERQEVTGKDGGAVKTESKVLPMVGVLPDGKKVGHPG